MREFFRLVSAYIKNTVKNKLDNFIFLKITTKMGLK